MEINLQVDMLLISYEDHFPDFNNFPFAQERNIFPNRLIHKSVGLVASNLIYNLQNVYGS